MFSRREFLARTIWLAALPSFAREHASQGTVSRTITPYTAAEVQALGAAMDEIVPGGEGMPSACTVGGVAYLQSLVWQYPDISEQIGRFLNALAQKSNDQFHEKFTDLRPDQRVQVLAAIEKTDARLFGGFLRSVYESYYASPRVLGLIWCPPNALTANDIETLLAPVRKLQHVYREVP